MNVKLIAYMQLNEHLCDRDDDEEREYNKMYCNILENETE